MAEVLENIAIYHSKSLIEKSRKGDEHAYGKLVGLWFKRIYNFSLKYFADHDLAMEVTQQTFIVVYKKINRLKDVDNFKYWLYKIALNHCREEDRRQKRTKWYSIFISEDARQVESKYGHPEIEYQKKENEELIAELLRTLPEEQKTVIIMKEFEGMKFREISETLNISENTAKSRLYYGFKALKKILEKSELNYKIDS
ncbi:MAG: sigma-70 family RNA polymerase sigma factor [Cyclobacteriaceae bacterium]|nr:sigma-70 family RNA polymerase sigma factor [Cyclobacteriaceae bacterium]